MATPIKRLNYFDQLFLRVGDFRTEQDYHRRMLREHNRTLHTAGVAGGLTVAPAGTAVTVSSGVAVDADGEEIVLVDAQMLDLADQPAGQPVYVTIAYRALATDPETGTSNATRYTDSPLIAKSLSAPADPDRTLILGLAQRSGTTVTSVAPGGRKRSGETVVGPLSIQGALSANAGATANGLSLGRDPGTGVDYPWEYETVGVTQPNFNLRLQSPNSVIVHCGGAQRAVFHPGGLAVQTEASRFSELVVGSGGNGRVRTRHLDGKHYANDDDDNLYLNWGSKRPVETGGDLRIHGPNIDWGGDQSGAGYIRLGALQICWGTVRFTGRYGEMPLETPFPAPFGSLPAVVVTLDDTGFGFATPTSSVGSHAVRTNAFVVLYKGGAGARIGPLTASWVAMGRWR